MMYWGTGIFCYMAWQYEKFGFVADSMMVSVFLQFVYVAKFFYWETGYWCTMDIQHDRAGYYICWGCLVYLPCLYTSQSYYLASHPIVLGTPLALAIFATGVLMIWINYDADRQRQAFRANNGKLTIWGKPAKGIIAEYVTEKGEQKTSLLLASGWWGVSRHFHYVPEILASVCWSIPALFTHVMPWSYSMFLTVLLVDRAFRDDARCSSKYKEHWERYCQQVPAKIIPGIV
jgi:7-dehydrocholesterol reductase